MIRVLVMVVLAAALVAGAVLGERWLARESPAIVDAKDSTTACHPLREPCRWQTSAGEASVAMEHLDGDELALEATLPETPERVMVVLTGESMYMGEYPLRLERMDEPGHYRARFVPPFCTTGDAMVWQVSLRIGNDPVVLPFRLLFEPHS